MQLSNGDINIDFLNQEFPEVTFKTFASDDNSLITCFACWFNTAEALVQHWESIQNLLSSHFQPKLPASKWNVYLALFSPSKLSKQSKYSIQNDKFFARKIVIDNKTIDPHSDAPIDLLRNDLLGLDLKLVQETESLRSEYKSELSDFISGNASNQKPSRVAFIKLLIDKLESI